MIVSFGSLVCLLALTSSGGELVIDAMDYPTDEAARQAWKVGWGTSVAMGGETGDRALRLAAPFGDQPDRFRIFVERIVSLNLAAPGSFRLRVACPRPEVVREVTLHFHSGDGWYSAGGGLPSTGWCELVFPKAAFRVEGKPTGWHQIDQIRISAWRAKAENTSLRLGALSSVSHDVMLILPRAEDDRDARNARDAARRLAYLLGSLGLQYDTIDQQAIAAGALAGRRVVILPYNRRLSGEAVDALVDFVQHEGKLIVCYEWSPKLLAVLGFAPGAYVRQNRPGEFAEMRFDAPDIVGLPRSVRQASWNIITAAPNEHNARAIAQWHDAEGNPTDHAAMLLSDRGALLTHLVLSDDREGKRQLLGAVLGHLAPPLWREMAAAALDKAVEVGHCRSFEEVAAWVREHPTPVAQSAFDQASAALAEAKQRFDAGEYFDAIKLADDAHGRLADAYLRTQSSPTREARAWWVHSALGPYPGDWDRTAREVSAAGFNMILPNMLWGGSAAYASDVLPRDANYQKHGDQIAQCLAAAHRNGLEVHVWKVNYNLGGRAPEELVAKLRAEGRLQVSVRGEVKDWLCPSHPENFRLECAAMVEVAQKYDVDGLHFDYIRYPGRGYCYCDGCRRRFEEATGRRVARWPDDCLRGDRKEEYNTWRCQQITRLVAEVSREARQVRPGIKISAAVSGSYPKRREAIGQDWLAWVREGYLDFLCPMDYTANDALFRGRVSNQLRLIEGRVPLYPGIGASATSISFSPDQIVGQIGHARTLGAAGFTIFNLGAREATELLPGIALGATAQKATPPHADP